MVTKKKSVDYMLEWTWRSSTERMSTVRAINNALCRVPVWPFYILGFIPMAWELYLAVTNQLGADPVKALEHSLGLTALQLIIATLCVTPLCHFTKINLVRFRRMIGLMAFYYALAHFAVYLFLDLQLLWGQIWDDLIKRPYIMLGTFSLVTMLPLALTSNNRVRRKMGPLRWRKLHWLVYPCAAAAAAHYVWLVKSWPMQPLVYAGIVAALLAWRVGVWLRKKSAAKTAQMATTPARN